jgi:hypothetical protein
MATTSYKVLGQISPSAASATTLYTVPAVTQTVVSTLIACNQDTATCTIRVAVRPDGETLASKHYVAFDVTLAAKQTITFTLGITADAADVITVYSSNAVTSFNAFGSETA